MSPSGLHVAMFTPWRERCGIREYSQHLIEGLRALPEIADVRIVEAPSEAVRGALTALRRFPADARRWQALGREMNAGPDGLPSDVAHVQHQYFFFGGVAPHKNHARAFLDAVRVPLVVTAHEIARPGPYASALERHAIALTNRANFLHPAIQQIVVHTEPDRQELLALGAAPERVHVLIHPVPPAQPMPPSDEAKRALGLEGKRVVTLFGFLSAKKGHSLALVALRNLPADVVLLFAGDRHPDDHTDYVPRLQSQIAAEGLAGRVRITGFLPDAQIPIVMAATDVAIAPFVQSSGSGSLTYLLAYARPIVASDIAPNREIDQELPGCLALFPSGDAEALATQILFLLDDPARRAALEAAAQAFADRHSYPQMARATAAIYALACR
ncbi:MAG TPA: glycosyltransferase [Chthonomonadaceae bacterium]|nr:glycosyltransferase [Chthonomonadaceae bacterium]